jgi:hypothetical protein
LTGTNGTKLFDSDVEEVFKSSYWTMYENLTEFNTPALAFPIITSWKEKKIFLKLRKTTAFSKMILTWMAGTFLQF